MKTILPKSFGLRLSFHPLRQDEYLKAVSYWLDAPELNEATQRAALQFARSRSNGA